MKVQGFLTRKVWRFRGVNSERFACLGIIFIRPKDKFNRRGLAVCAFVCGISGTLNKKEKPQQTRSGK